MAQKKLTTFDLDIFKDSIQGMVNKTPKMNSYWSDYESWRSYKLEDVLNILDHGNTAERIKLSQHFFKAEALYRTVILYYATFLQYKALVIPKYKNVDKPAKKSEKVYFEAMDFCEINNIPELCYEFARTILINGSYAGVVSKLDRKNLAIVNIPYPYYRSRFKDVHNRDILEMDLGYFDDYAAVEGREAALAAYPQYIQKAYAKYKKGKGPQWVLLPEDVGFFLSLTEEALPPFLNIIPAIFYYDIAIETEQERELDGISKIVVQHIPHLNTGELLFEPPEVEVMHNGVVDMLRNNRNVSVLTTYGEVDSISSKGSNEGIDDILEKIYDNIYIQCGVSPQLFSPTDAASVKGSLVKDLSMMMILANKFSKIFTRILNSVFGDKNMGLEYKILSLSYHNQKEFLDDSLNLAQNGYSFMLPAIAMGIDQHELLNLKVLENDVLELRNYLIPLKTSYTLSAEDAKIENEEGLNKKPNPEEDPNAGDGNKEPTPEEDKAEKPEDDKLEGES